MENNSMDMLFFASGSSMWVCETERETAPLMLCWNLPETVKINCLISIQCQHTITHQTTVSPIVPRTRKSWNPVFLPCTHSCHHANPTNR